MLVLREQYLVCFQLSNFKRFLKAFTDWRDAFGNIDYYNGQGVKIDKVYAHMWASIASSNGFDNSKGLLETLNKEMTPSQIEEAQRLARECVKKKYKGC